MYVSMYMCRQALLAGKEQDAARLRLHHPCWAGGFCPFKGWLSRETTPPVPDSQSGCDRYL